MYARIYSPTLGDYFSLAEELMQKELRMLRGSKEVDWFAGIMKGKLQMNLHKPHWSTQDVYSLIALMLKEIEELKQALIKEEGSAAIAKECADVANFAMFIADITRVGGVIGYACAARNSCNTPGCQHAEIHNRTCDCGPMKCSKIHDVKITCVPIYRRGEQLEGKKIRALVAPLLVSTLPLPIETAEQRFRLNVHAENHMEQGLHVYLPRFDHPKQKEGMLEVTITTSSLTKEEMDLFRLETFTCL